MISVMGEAIIRLGCALDDHDLPGTGVLVWTDLKAYLEMMRSLAGRILPQLSLRSAEHASRNVKAALRTFCLVNSDRPAFLLADLQKEDPLRIVTTYFKKRKVPWPPGRLSTAGIVTAAVISCVAAGAAPVGASTTGAAAAPGSAVSAVTTPSSWVPANHARGRALRPAGAPAGYDQLPGRRRERSVHAGRAEPDRPARASTPRRPRPSWRTRASCSTAGRTPPATTSGPRRHPPGQRRASWRRAGPTRRALTRSPARTPRRRPARPR